MISVEYLADRFAFMCAWATEIGEQIEPTTADLLLDHGWTIPLVEEVSSLAVHALRYGTGLTIPPVTWQASGERLDHREVAERLTALLQILVHDCRLTVEAAFGWLRVVTGSPEPEPHNAVQRLTWTDTRTGQVAADWSQPTLMAAWTEAAPGAVASLAWAAGLTLGEARQGWSDGTVTEERLRVLAGLRGFRLP